MVSVLVLLLVCNVSDYYYIISDSMPTLEIVAGYSWHVYGMKLSSCDVISCIDLGDRFCFCRKDRIGGGGWVHLKSADSMAVSVFPFRNALVGSG